MDHSKFLVDLNFKHQYSPHIFQKRFRNFQSLPLSNLLRKAPKDVLNFFIFLSLLICLIILGFLWDETLTFLKLINVFLSQVLAFLYTSLLTLRGPDSIQLYFSNTDSLIVQYFEKNLEFHQLFNYKYSIHEVHRHLNLIFSNPINAPSHYQWKSIWYFYHFYEEYLALLVNHLNLLF